MNADAAILERPDMHVVSPEQFDDAETLAAEAEEAFEAELLDLESRSLYSVDAFDQFVNIAGRHRILSNEEVVELAKGIERGDLDAREKLITHNLRLVIGISGRYGHKHLERIDLVNEGVKGLIRATEMFDYRLGYTFSTYATNWIQQTMKRALANTDRIIRHPVPVVEHTHRIEQAEKRLEQRHGGRPLTAEEIAVECRLSAERVEEIKSLPEDAGSIHVPIARAEGPELMESIIPASDVDTAQEATDRITHKELYEAMADLTETERRVIKTLYFDGTGGSIHLTSSALGMKAREVRQVRDSALTRLHESIAGGTAEEMAKFLQEEAEERTPEAMCGRVWGLKEKNPKLTYDQIGDLLGIHPRRAREYHRNSVPRSESD